MTPGRLALGFVLALGVLLGVTWGWLHPLGDAGDEVSSSPAVQAPASDDALRPEPTRPDPRNSAGVEPGPPEHAAHPDPDLEEPSDLDRQLTEAGAAAVAHRIGSEIEREPSEMECTDDVCTTRFEVGDEDPDHLKRLVLDGLRDFDGEALVSTGPDGAELSLMLFRR